MRCGRYLIADGRNEEIQAVIDAGVIRRSVELTLHANASIVTPALRTVANVVTGDDQQTQIAIQAGCIPAFARLLTHQKKNVRKEATWAISNLTAGNREQVQQVIDANIFPAVINMLRTAEFEIRKEAAWCVSNATSIRDSEQINYMVSQGAVEALCSVLDSHDPKIIVVALEGLENILAVSSTSDSRSGVNQPTELLQACGGLESIQQLQQHANEDIYRKAAALLQKHFDAEDEQAGEPTAFSAGGGVPGGGAF